MIAGLDSSYDAPAASDADAARAAGVGLWNGYLATRAGVGLLAPWTQAAFDNARRCGGTPIAFCSGWDDAAAVRAMAAAWNVRACLDDENGIRPSSSYDRQSWLDASGAGLYGLHAVVNGQLVSVHVGLRAAFHVAAWYPGGDPGTTWPAGTWRPDTPVGWQFQGTHTELGRQVDRGWFDDWFGDGEMAKVGLDATDDVVAQLLKFVADEEWATVPGDAPFVSPKDELLTRIRDIDTIVKVLQQPVVDVAALAAALAGDTAFVAAIAQAVVHLEGAKLAAP